ncbi:MAG: single-stranded DNA-binding protein [Saccharofermentans sp.]|nr:single-stranded DNA-binding protein [Saccharofermentans sp.]
MNKVVLVGRLTKDPEIKNTSSQVQFCNFTVAVDRRFKDQNGQRQADFINCVAWRQTATFISSYFHKGSKIGIVGSLQSRSFDDNNGQKRYVTEVVVDEAEFVESAATGRQGSAPAASPAPAPAAGSVAASAPTAPSTAIAPDLDEDAFDADGSLDLPFEF